MVWRRVLVPADCTLRELHGVFQVAMGWEGIHLFQFCFRAARYGSWELSASSPEVTLESLRLRTGARFTYEYDLNIPWRHEVRHRGPAAAGPGKPTPLLGGSGLPAGGLRRSGRLHGRRDAMAVRWMPLRTGRPWPRSSARSSERRTDPLDDEDTRWRWSRPSSGQSARAGPGRPFSRRTVNARFRDGEHHNLMHQQD